MFMTEATLTRSDLIEAIYKEAHITRSDATLIFDTLLETIYKLLKDNSELKILKFGSFLLKDKVARVGRNPKTGEEVEIKAHKAVSFKPHSTLKARIENTHS